MRPSIRLTYIAAPARVLARLSRMVAGQASNVPVRNLRRDAPEASLHRKQSFVTLMRGVLASLVIITSPLVLILQGQVAQGETTHSEAAGKAAAIEVSIQAGMLTLRASNAPLAEVLNAIGEHAGMEIVLKGDLSNPITQSFSGMALDQGLQRLLDGANFVMIYGSVHDEGSPRPLVELRVYGGVAGEIATTGESAEELAEGAAAARRAVMLGIAPQAEGDMGLHEDIVGLERDDRIHAMRWLADLGDTAAVTTLGRFLALDKVSSVRSEAAMALSNIGGEAAVKALELGLGDDNPDVRFQVVDALSGIDGRRTALLLGQVLFSEPDVEIRMTAVLRLGEEHSEAARSFLEAAAEDPDDWVRETANSILGFWD